MPLPPGFVPPCLPTKALRPPSGELWLHEIKHDGFRVIARVEGSRVRLFSRRGHDWSDRFPRIGEAPASLRARSITIDGEAVILCPKTGLSLVDELHSGRRDHDVILYAFDLLELNGKDPRALPLEERKARLADLLTPGVFRHACKLGCEGIVSKQRSSLCRSGRARTWIKVKNPDSPAMTRVWER
jgi:bifunctional non-homologous end joining protein LigD